MSMTCYDLKHIFQRSVVNDGSSSCCIHSDEDQGFKTLVLYQKSCEYVRNLFDGKCCHLPLETELDGFAPSCEKDRICTVNSPLGSGPKTCTHRICQARSLIL